MAQCIVIQVGQCGNQIGSRFWDLVSQEHAKYDKQGSGASTFFRHELRSQRNGTTTTALKARGVMVDMEEGVLSQIRSSPLRQLFSSDQIVSSCSGSGNNWGMGYSVYGPEFRDRILECIRMESEQCDYLQAFFTIGSLGGGTGSGLGSYILELLHEEFPEVYKFSTALLPSETDDVVTSPYNTMLAMNKLVESVDCILPIENDALLRIYDHVNKQSNPASGQRDHGSALTDSGLKPFGALAKGYRKHHPFEEMNNIVGNLLVNLTSSMRFDGSLNVDINDLVTNLVPFPRQKLLISTMTPIVTYKKNLTSTTKQIDQIFRDAFMRDNQLLQADTRSGKCEMPVNSALTELVPGT
ncbi:Tubulin epsilon chain [Blyttiomyces sp. JEL0837]|nr:Tubulin epsilon chain [Blyttiomyces sp. JEL0837]